MYYMYVIRWQQRDALMTYLKQQGIECGIHYPLPLHLQPAYAPLNLKKGQFPVSEQLAKEIVSIPLYPELTDAQRQFIVDQIKKFVNQ